MKKPRCSVSNGYRIAVKGNADFIIKVDGNKYNPKKDFISAGEHTVEVFNRIYLIKWYGIFLAILDYILSLFACDIKDIGDVFIKQGYIKYSLIMKGDISGDIYLKICKDELPQFISGNMEIVQYDAQPCLKLEKVLKKYRRNVRIITAVLLFVIVAALTAAIVISNI